TMMAHYYLGCCYDKGNGVSQDLAKAAQEFAIAANQGHPFSQFNLADCYYTGKGVDKDFARAAELFAKAADSGLREAYHMLGCIYYQGGYGVTKDLSRAAQEFKKAVDRGYVRAKRNLAFCYLNGEGVTKDEAMAIKLLSELMNDPENQDEFSTYLRGNRNSKVPA
ncbi:MAG: tetratricopeptide repeat protein, partial [Alphaproteobacteria bacterium]|nr:tetratricopeptide repeat protein [Alphaproteobacteria bacterium]